MYKKILLPRRGSGETRGYITLKPSYFHFLLTVGLGEVVGLDGLGDGANLVDLEEKGVASLLVNSHLERGSFEVSHSYSSDLVPFLALALTAKP